MFWRWRQKIHHDKFSLLWEDSLQKLPTEYLKKKSVCGRRIKTHFNDASLFLFMVMVFFKNLEPFYGEKHL